MDKAALVNFDIDRGTEVLSALDRVNLKIRVALWLYALPENSATVSPRLASISSLTHNLFGL